jgi:hypothetical protein
MSLASQQFSTSKATLVVTLTDVMKDVTSGSGCVKFLQIPAATIHEPEQAGFLIKQSCRSKARSWSSAQKRWFVLKDKYLFYFKKKEVIELCHRF